MKEEIVTVDLLHKLLVYDEDNGLLYWRYRPIYMFEGDPSKLSGIHAAWNKRMAGKVALNNESKRGGLTGTIKNMSFHAHRVVWAMHHGRWPEGVIDHIDGNSRNNKIENLRDVKQVINARNCRKSKNNTSGVNGVWWDKRYKKWCAEIKLNYKKKHLGYFEDIKDAERARVEEEKKHMYHKTHGRR